MSLLLPVRWFFLVILLSSCAGRHGGTNHPAPQPPKPGGQSDISHQPPTPPLQGTYAAGRLTGDYAAYPALLTFIDRMVQRHGFPKAYLLGLFSEAHRKQWTLDYMTREAPPATPQRNLAPRPGGWTRYRAQFLTDFHIGRGVTFWSKHTAALQKASQRFGVPESVILGILGVETAYGANLGKDRILDALTTLAFDYPRRADYFTGELENFLLMTRSEGMDPAQPKGSYAGAMGLGQFMPGSFLQWAVDLDGDGRRDLWNPADAIGSVANYFAVHGWHHGDPVVTPARTTSPRYKLLEYGYDKTYSLPTLAEYGVEPASSLAGLSTKGQAPSFRFLRLGIHQGEEHWLGHDNFYVITRYNHSTHYAMAVYELGEAVRQRYEKWAHRG